MPKHGRATWSRLHDGKPIQRDVVTLISAVRPYESLAAVTFEVEGDINGVAKAGNEPTEVRWYLARQS